MTDTASAPASGFPGTFEHSLLDQVPAAVIVSDWDGIVTHWNREAEAMYGWSRAEVVGRHITDITVPLGGLEEANRVLDLVRSGEEWHGEFPVTHRDGRTFPAYVTLSALRDESGRMAGVVGVSVDITERRRSERRLAAQHAVTRALAEASTLEEAAPRLLEGAARALGWNAGLIWTVAPRSQTLRVIETWSEAGTPAEPFLEASRATDFGKGVGLPGRVWERGTSIWLPDFGGDKTLPRGPMALDAGLRGAVAFPIRLRGEFLGVVEFLSAHVEEPDEELLQTMNAIGSQVGQFIERTEAERHLQEAEARYRTLVENTPVVSYTNAIGNPSRCLYISPQIEALTGHTAEEWMSSPNLWQRLLHPEDRDEEAAKDAAHNLSGEPYHSEYRLVAADGRVVWVRDDAVIIPAEPGGDALWQGVMVDVTERKLVELQLRARAQQQETVADIGRLALTGTGLQTLMDRAVDMVCETLGLEHCELLELQEDGDSLVMRAGRGWIDLPVGSVAATGPKGLPGFSLSRGEPIVVEDLEADDRFTEKEILRRHGIVSGISAIVRGPLAPWGVLAALSTERRAFPPDDVYFIRAVANVLAMAIQRARFEEQRASSLASEQTAREEAERARERLRFLAEASSVLSSSLDYEATLSRLAHLAVPEMADWCVVYQLTESGEMRRLTIAHAGSAHQDAAEELQAGVRLDPDADVGVPKVIRTGLPVLYTDADPALVASDSSDPEAARRITEDIGICSWMCVPLNARGRTIGAISFLSGESGRRFDEEDLTQAMELARHAALAVDNAQLYESELEARRATERAAQRTALLQAVTAALSEALGPADVGEIVVDRCVAAMGASAGVVALLTPASDELEILRVVGYRPEIGEQWKRFPVGANLPMSDAVRTEEPVFITSREERDRLYPELAGTPMENQAVVTVPLVVESRAIGAMTLSFADPREFPPEDRAFLLALARQAAQALERSRLYQAERNARAEAERANARLEFLAEASEILSRSLDYRQTMAEVARLAVPGLADWCTIDMLEDGEITSVAVAHVEPEKMQLARDLRKRLPPNPDDPTGVPNVIRTGQPELWPEISPELIADAIEDPEIRQLVLDLHLRSLMIVPLTSRGRAMGAITFVWSESGRTYGAADLALAQDLARRAAQAVENAMIYRERDYIARTLQQSLLPPDLPEIPGVELAARYLPAGEGNEVGGDFYDVFDTGDGAWGLAIGDVCGKGPDAAAVMGLAKYSLRAAAMRERRPSRILDIMNEAVMRQTTDGRFLTVAYARIRPAPGSVRLTVSCGGHPLPAILRADGAMETAGRPGTLLGLFPDPELADDTVDLGPGDLMVVYTDGVTDTPGFAEGTGERRLTEVLAECAGLTADDIADRIEREVLAPKSLARRDDVAFVILRVLP
jgi:PAS domain S-box-containing protein